MNEAPKKGNPALSIDRAAFLLLRVKKAFKKKRQQRKERQAAQQAAAALTSQTRAFRKGPQPPLLRSRTLPAIIVPGISILNAQIDPNRLSTGDAFSNIPSCSARYSLQPKSSRASLASDDSTIEFRRKSSGSTHSGPSIINSNPTTTEPYIYACDDLERHPDGTVILRIPAPHVVAARAYRISSASSSTSGGSTSGYFLHPTSSSAATTAQTSGNSSNSSTTALYRLARLLNQSSKSSPGQQSPPSKDDSQRRLSWERRDNFNNRIPRSSSIDSMVETIWNDSPRPSLDVPRDSISSASTTEAAIVPTSSSSLQQSVSQHQFQYNQHLQPYQLNTNYGSFSGSFVSRRESLLSPSPGRRTKQNRGIAEITLPDLVTRTNLQTNTIPVADSPPQTPTTTKNIISQSQKHHQQSSLSSSSSSQNVFTQETSKFVNHFKLKSPSLLFKQNSKYFNQEQINKLNLKKSSSQTSLSSSPSSTISMPADMEFLIPQLPSSKQHHKHQQGHSNHSNHNDNYHHHQQQQTQKPQNGKITINQNITSSNETTANIISSTSSTSRSNTLSGGSGLGILHQLPQQLQIKHQANKMTKKQVKLAQAQLNKLTQINIHLHALFSAVEHGHLDKARTILESTDVDVNSLNSDGLSALDVAVLSNNRSMTKMLLQNGAIEGTQFKNPETLGNHLNGLLHDAENRVHDLSSSDDIPQPPFSTRASFSSIIGNSGSSSVTGCTGTEADKQLGLWERRVKGLKRMILGWDQARPPDMPSAITVDVSGLNSVTVCILEPMEGTIGTKFKVQWSTRADFSNIVGEREILEWSSYQGVMGATCRITELTQGRRYFFRASCGNIKGWGPYRTSIPTSVIPSSWRDMDNREHRFAGRQRILDDLFTAVRLARPDHASEISLEIPTIQRRNPKKKTTIKQLFSAASKFQKNLRRGIYLACVLYYDDKILVTNEDFLPVIEIDETYPSSLHADYHWFMKVACTWDDVKSLRTDMERYSTSAAHFRTKLLSAACQMQSALCITDLGQLYHKPLRDSHGTVVLSCVNTVKSPKNISVLNSRWIPINKIQKKVTALHEDNKINEILISSISDQINYHQTSSIKLPRGLYLGYLKLQSSVDQIQVVVPAKTPNVLPHSKIRENPHISAEEWEVLRRDKQMPSLEFRPKKEGYTEVQHLFLEALTSATHKLFNFMNINPIDALTHRLYDIEVIELGFDVSFLIVCPPVESSCAVPGQREILFQRSDLLTLPIQAFEMIHLKTYQNNIIQKYSRLSCILELDTALANHSHREAFSTVELQIAKERLSKLQELTSNLNAIWKGVRWLMDVIAFARDRSCQPKVSMKEILEFNCNRDDDLDNAEEECCNRSTSKLQLLQLPQRDNKLIKSSPGRGSWPGPAANNANSSCYLGAEHSKSEQNLGCSLLATRYLSANSEVDYSSRKNSADSNCSQSGSYFSAGESSDPVLPRLPPSRSEDTLVVTKRHSTVAHHRKRATTVNEGISSTSSPHLNVKIVPSTSSGTYQCKNAAESVQSLSSDSESASYPLMTSTPSKSKQKEEKRTTSYLRPTLTALQSEIKLFKEPLHISEPTTPKSFTLTQQQPIPSTSSAPAEQSRRMSVRQSSDDEDLSGYTSNNGNENIPCQPGIIQVYAAYETGLANGTSLKLHVTPKTSAREVIDLVVKQLNMAVVLKGKDGPIYPPDKLENFCLVAVIGARERCLRDDFKPLQLQNPWKKGRLYVRQKHDLLAAIEHSNREAHLI